MFKDNSEQTEGLVSSSFQENKDGIIGISLFKDQKLIIDYSAKKVIFFNNKLLPKSYRSLKWKKFDLEMSDDGLVISGNIGSKAVRFLIDTGATASILKPSFVDENTQQGQKIEKSISFNNFNIRNIKFYLHEFQEPQVDGILGYNFFLRQVVCLDLIESKIYFLVPSD